MAFSATLLDVSGPKIGYGGAIRSERWTASGTVSDTDGTVTARYLTRVDRAEIFAYGGQVQSYTVSGRELRMILPGTTSSPLTYLIRLIQDGTL